MAKIITGDQIMQDFDFSKEPVGITRDAVEKMAAAPLVQKYLSELEAVAAKTVEQNYGFDSMLGVINSGKDVAIRKKIKTVADAVRQDVPDMKYVIHCGIGGSELGATMLISATGKTDAEYIPITSLNNDHIARILDRIDPQKTVLIKSTRSNTTKETLTAFTVFASALEDALGDTYRKHCVAVIGKDLEGVAKKDDYHFVPVETNMSGRYTALHSANIFSMQLMGVDVSALHEGARHMLARSVSGRTIDDNPALELAVHNYLMNTHQGKSVWNTGVFSPQLVKYGDWLGQLVEESLGHNELIGIATKTSELSNKAHSYFQGWLEGANNTYHQFLFPLGQNERTVMNPSVSGETLRDIEFAEYTGIAKALANEGRPSYTTFMKSINENALGQLMMRDIIATMVLGEMLGLRTESRNGVPMEFGYFNQPGVEAYKVLMKAELKDQDALHRTIANLEAKFK